MSVLKTLTFTMTVDVEIDGDVPDQKIIDTILEKFDLSPTLVDDEDKDLYVIIESIGLELREE